ncbi:MAG: hypothetical protein J2O47_00425, partial [Acidimicrobiaceae bacterium]|nr:hypothetical protein [Acidimicrobiaceae bacterium]
MSRQPGDMRPGRPDRPGNQPGGQPPANGGSGNWRWAAAALVVVLILALILSSALRSNTGSTRDFSSFASSVKSGQVASAKIDKTNGAVQYTMKDGQQFSTTEPSPDTSHVTAELNSQIPVLRYTSGNNSVLVSFLPWIFYA